jgi:ribonuclease HII
MTRAPLPFVLDTDASGLVAGVDEVGRGPLAGDVVAAAVILDPSRPIANLRDSKQLSPARRDALHELILDCALAWGVGRASPAEIDDMNILQASLLAMQRAVLALPRRPDFVYVDGNRLPRWDFRARAVIKGDGRIAAVAAASILAKVTRDREFDQLDALYPGYGFARHKGYPTPEHLQALRELGASPIHRCSFAPVREVLAVKTGSQSLHCRRDT